MNAEKTLKKMGFLSTDEEGVYVGGIVVDIGFEFRTKLIVDRNGVDYVLSLAELNIDDDGNEAVVTFARGRAFPKTDEELVNLVANDVQKHAITMLQDIIDHVKAHSKWCGKFGRK